MATIKYYVRPQRLYRYRSLKHLEREIDAIEDGYLFCAPYTELNDPMEGLFSSSHLLRESEDYRAIRNAIRENKAQIGMCSFSEVHDHELMWAHYADQFRGICRVFRTFGEGSLLLCTARTRHKLDQAACNTRIRSKSSLARPYI